MISKSNNNSYHDGTSAFFQRFFRKSLHLNAVEKEKKTDIDQIWQSQIKEIAVNLRQVEMQYEVSKLDASSSKYDTAQRGLS